MRGQRVTYVYNDTVHEIFVPGEIVVAEGRAETEPCQKGTEGCCVDHDAGGETCETW